MLDKLGIATLTTADPFTVRNTTLWGFTTKTDPALRFDLCLVVNASVLVVSTTMEAKHHGVTYRCLRLLCLRNPVEPPNH